LFLPAEHDPDSYVRELGAEAFRAKLGEAMALSRFLLDELGARHNLAEAEGRASCLHEARPLLAAMPECALRLQIEREMARQVLLTPEEMAQLLAQAPARPYGAAPAIQATSTQSHPDAAAGAQDAPDFHDAPPPDFDYEPVGFDYDGEPAGAANFQPGGRSGAR